MNKLSAKYRGKVQFIAVAGKSGMDKTAEVADSLLTANVKWGLDESVWDLYGIPGQPATVLIKQGVVVGEWFGVNAENVLTSRINELLAL